MIIEKAIENKVIVENGKIRTIFTEEIENNGGWMDIEEARRLTIEGLNMIEKSIINDNKNT